MKFTSSLKLKLIYVFRINDAAHRGCLKVGEATCDNDNVFGLAPNSKALNESAKKRINQYTQTAGIAYDLLYTELTIYNSRKGLCSFNDKEVHSGSGTFRHQKKDIRYREQGQRVVYYRP